VLVDSWDSTECTTGAEITGVDDLGIKTGALTDSAGKVLGPDSGELQKIEKG
jgi:hypothetical protein